MISVEMLLGLAPLPIHAHRGRIIAGLSRPGRPLPLLTSAPPPTEPPEDFPAEVATHVQQAVWRALHYAGATSAGVLAAKLGMRQRTVARILQSWERDGLVRESGRRQARNGAWEKQYGIAGVDVSGKEVCS